jgi:hypothetical protein
LPTPLSPRMSTGVGTAANRTTTSSIARIFWLCLKMSLQRPAESGPMISVRLELIKA